MMILAATADGEIEQIRKRIEIDWDGGFDRMQSRVDQGLSIENTLVRLRSGRRDWFVSTEPNRMIYEYLRDNTEPIE